MDLDLVVDLSLFQTFWRYQQWLHFLLKLRTLLLSRPKTFFLHFVYYFKGLMMCNIVSAMVPTWLSHLYTKYLVSLTNI